MTAPEGRYQVSRLVPAIGRDGGRSERAEVVEGVVAELVAERFRVAADHGLVVDERAASVVLDRVDAALVSLSRRHPEISAEVEQVRRLCRPARPEAWWLVAGRRLALADAFEDE